MFRRQTSSLPGFTLLELLLYVGVIAFMLLAMSVLLSLSIQSRVKQQAIAEVEQQGAAMVSTISQVIRNASDVTSPLAGATSTSLSVTVSTASASPTAFDVSSAVLRMTEGSAAPVALHNARVSVSNVVFQNVSRASTSGIVRMSFTVSATSTSGRSEYQFSKTFYASAALHQ